MDYIIHHRLKGKCICGDVNLPYGTALHSEGKFIVGDVGIICAVISQQAKEHIARNDDGRGLERGKLTYAIAFKGMSHPGFRFDEKQRETITKTYSRFIRSDCDFIIFNDDFFNADVDELREMANTLNIKH